MVSHLRLEARQRYEQQVCLSCVTGLYGCRWKRYQRSTSDTSWKERIWFIISILGFSFMVLWLYFWLIIRNDWDDVNWYVYDALGFWFDWFLLFLVLVLIFFIYTAIMMVLVLCHIMVGQEIYLHWLHKIMVILILISSVFTIVIFCNLSPAEWSLVRLSFLIFAPILQIIAVVLLTCLTWLIAGAWAKLRSMGLKIGVLSVYICITLFLYLSPLLMNSPCVTTVIPRKPLLVGHRGAQQLAPENTMSAFVTSAKYSVYGFESDVQISADGVPFLLHDKSLERTTNVEEVFPDRASDDPSTFNISDLKKLDAGSWYVTTDPFRNVDSLSETTKNWYSNQTIPKYTDWLEYAAQENKIVLFDLHQPPENHTYHETWIELVVNLTLTSSLPQHLVWWLPGSNRDEVMEAAPGFVQVSGGYEWFYNLDKLNKQYDEINNDQIQSLEKKNVSTNIYIVNSKWLFSLYWCIELPTVTTGACHELEKMEEPMWHLSPDVYLIVWITIDVVSAIIIVIIFFIQRHRYSEHHVAETISLASVSEQFNQESASTVKEKFRALLTRLRHRHLDHVPEVIGMHSPRRPKSSKRDEKLVLAPNENPEDQSISRDESHASINTADLPNGEISTDESLESLPQMNHTEIRVELS